MRHHYSSLGVARLLQRAASAGGASTVHSLASAGSVSAREPLTVASLPEDDDRALVARAEYRSWREGSPVHHHRPRHHPRLVVEQSHSLQPSRLNADYDMASASLLGKGGFGLVYAATSRLDGHRYALKLLPNRGSAEARCMADLGQHANIVRYCSAWTEAAAVSELRAAIGTRNGTGGHEVSDDDHEEEDDEDDEDDASGDTVSAAALLRPRGRPATTSTPPMGSLVLQLELVRSPTLHEVLRGEMDGGAHPAPATARVRWEWIAGVANGLEHMHAAGWVHNDVKPANIFCGKDGSAKLGDMGLASRWPLTATHPPLSTHHLAAGTPLYLAPERRRVLLSPEEEEEGDDVSMDASPPCDIYSLGVVTAEVFGAFATAMERATVLDGLKREAAAAAAPPREDTVRVRAQRIPTRAAEALALRMLATRPSARPRPEAVARQARAEGR